MQLWKVYQTDNASPKAVKSMIVVARSEEDAKLLDPSNQMIQWAHSEKNIGACYLGRTTHFTNNQIIMKSFENFQ